MNHQTAEIEREVERSRDRVERTVDALKDKMSLGQMVDEMTRYARANGATEMFANFGSQVKSNPLPLALIGAGIAMLMWGSGSPRREHRAYGHDGVGDPARGNGASAASGHHNGGMLGRSASAAKQAAGSAYGAARSAGSAAGNAISGATGAAHSAFDSTVEAGRSVGSTAAGAAAGVRDTVSSATGATRRAGSHVVEESRRAARAVGDIFEDEPLVIGAVGVAIGAAIGALLPSTEAEDRLVGETRDELVEGVERAIGEEIDRAGEVAADVYERNRESIGREFERAKDELSGALSDGAEHGSGSAEPDERKKSASGEDKERAEAASGKPPPRFTAGLP